MRDKLIHEYDTVDLEEVWRTATADIPQLSRSWSRWPHRRLDQTDGR